MSGILPNPLEWIKLLLDAQKAQIDLAQTMVETSTALLDPDKLEETGRQLEAAGKQAADAADQLFRAQWKWLGLWRC